MDIIWLLASNLPASSMLIGFQISRYVLCLGLTPPWVSGRRLGLQATQSPRGWHSGTAVGNGRQEPTKELGRGQGGNRGEDSEGSRWRRWRERLVSQNASEEPEGDSRGPGTCGMWKGGKSQSKAGWERGRWWPIQRDLGAFPGRSQDTHRGVPKKMQVNSYNYLCTEKRLNYWGKICGWTAIKHIDI